MLVVAVTFSDTLLIDTPVGHAWRTPFTDQYAKLYPLVAPFKTGGTYRAVFST